MARDPDDYLRVSFPATEGFSAVGRIAVAGLALRLGFDVTQVEAVRLAVDRATEALGGAGTVTITAQWAEDRLDLEIGNPEVGIDQATADDVAGDLAALIQEVTVGTDRIALGMES